MMIAEAHDVRHLDDLPVERPPVMPSMRDRKICPPSTRGIGRRLNRPESDRDDGQELQQAFPPGLRRFGQYLHDADRPGDFRLFPADQSSRPDTSG